MHLTKHIMYEWPFYVSTQHCEGRKTKGLEGAFKHVVM
jgi:hypothetical protein